ncbi:MAG: hypothetical protein K1060chlam5_00628 [Candidatus Anoxychlamydiales bacterium]|nr:hypothetical protein [Candidatus Anoxychlamydiales bacterium]
MNIFSPKTTNFSFINYSILIFFLFLIPISSKASECQIIFEQNNISSMNDSEIKEEISSYLINNSLCPVLINDEIKYKITGIFENSGIVYTLGTLSQGETCLYALFSFQKGWIWTMTNLLYMTTDIPQTPLLFKDICDSVQFYLPKSLSNYHVLIQKSPKSSTKNNLQLWTFYNKDQWIEFMVMIVDTPDGGTDFAIAIL